MFLNSLAVIGVVLFVWSFAEAFRRNYRIGARVYNIPLHVGVVGVIGTCWLLFGGA